MQCLEPNIAMENVQQYGVAPVEGAKQRKNGAWK